MPVDLFTLAGEVKITGLDAAEKGLVRVDDRAKGAAKGLDRTGSSARKLSKDLAQVGSQSSFVGRQLEDHLTGVASRVPLIGQPLSQATREMFGLGAASEKQLGGIIRDAERAAQKLSAVQAQAARVREAVSARRADFGESLRINYGGKIDTDFLGNFRSARNEAEKLKLLTTALGEESARAFTRVERSAFQFAKLEREGVKAVTAVESKVAQAAKGVAVFESATEGAAAGTAALGGAGAAAAVGVGLVAGAVIGAGALIVKSVRDYTTYAGAIKDIAQESGLAAPTVSTVGAYARLAGAEVGQAALAIEVYFKNVSQAAHGNKEMSKTFERMGIDAKKALEDPDRAARDLFDHLAKIQNPAERLEAAFKLAGKSGKVLANIAQEMGGSFDEAQRAAREWGVVLSDEDVAAADKFGDAVEIMQMKVEGSLYRIAKEALPEVHRSFDILTGKFDANRGAAEGWGVSIVNVMRGARLVVESDVGQMIAKLAELTSAFGWLNQLRLQAPDWMTDSGLAVLNPGFAAVRGMSRIGAADRRAEADARAVAEIDIAAGLGMLRGVLGKAPGGGARLGAVGGGKGGGGKNAKDLTSLYEALSDAEAARRIAGAAFDVSQFTAGLDAEESVLAASLRAQTVSVADYWKARERITINGLDAEINLLKTQQKIAGETYQAKFDAAGGDKKLSAEERALKQQQLSAQWAEKNYQLEGQIAAATEKRAAAMKTIPLEAAAAARELEKSMSSLRADALEAGGDTVGAAYARIADKYREMHEQARANSGLFPDADKWVAALERAEKLSANLARLGERFDLGKGNLNLETEKIQNRITDGVVGEREGRRQIYELEVKYRDVLRGILGESLAIAQARGDEKAVLSIRQQIEETERLGHVVDQTRAKSRGIFEGAFSHGLEELRGGLKHAAATFGIDLMDAVKREADARLTKIVSEALFGKNDEYGSDGGLISKALERIGLGGVFGEGKNKAKKDDPAAGVSATLEKTSQETQTAIENSSVDNTGNRDWNTDRIINALGQLGETLHRDLEALRPKQEGFWSGLLKTVANSAVSTLTHGLVGGLFSVGSPGGGGAATRPRRVGGAVEDVTVTVIGADVAPPQTRPRRVNPPGHALGGFISGPGSGTSDSILARLSAGEFVIRAAAVRGIGVSALSYANATGRLPKFAAGGVASPRAYTPPTTYASDARRPGEGGGRPIVNVSVEVRPDAQGRVRSRSQIAVEVTQESDSARRNM